MSEIAADAREPVEPHATSGSNLLLVQDEQPAEQPEGRDYAAAAAALFARAARIAPSHSNSNNSHAHKHPKHAIAGALFGKDPHQQLPDQLPNAFAALPSIAASHAEASSDIARAIERAADSGWRRAAHARPAKAPASSFNIFARFWRSTDEMNPQQDVPHASNAASHAARAPHASHAAPIARRSTISQHHRHARAAIASAAILGTDASNTRRSSSPSPVHPAFAAASAESSSDAHWRRAMRVAHNPEAPPPDARRHSFQTHRPPDHAQQRRSSIMAAVLGTNTAPTSANAHSETPASLADPDQTEETVERVVQAKWVRAMTVKHKESIAASHKASSDALEDPAASPSFIQQAASVLNRSHTTTAAISSHTKTSNDAAAHPININIDSDTHHRNPHSPIDFDASEGAIDHNNRRPSNLAPTPSSPPLGRRSTTMSTRSAIASDSSNHQPLARSVTHSHSDAPKKRQHRGITHNLLSS